MAHGLAKRAAIEEAAMARLRPVLMTGTVAALGFVPMMLSTGVGAEVQKPLATVVVFGMACDTFLTMLALPALYLLFGKSTIAPTVTTPPITRSSPNEIPEQDQQQPDQSGGGNRQARDEAVAGDGYDHIGVRAARVANAQAD